MHSDPVLVKRLKPIVESYGLEERVMFGGLSWFLNGHMCVGVYHDQLILRVGIEPAEQALDTDDFAKPMDLTGRAMKGWLMIEPGGLRTKKRLEHWAAMAVDFVATLPAKQPGKNRPG